VLEVWRGIQMRKLARAAGRDDGVTAVIVALLIVALVGVTAVVVDLGQVYVKKTQLQKSADAAALAGAQDIRFPARAIQKAEEYGAKNAPGATTVATTPYDGDAEKIEAVCTESVSYAFARVLGFDSGTYSARAVAIKPYSAWTGEALPFLNINSYWDDDTHVWEKVTPGDKESILFSEYGYLYQDDPLRVSFEVYYSDGVGIAKGTQAPPKDEIQDIYDRQTADSYVYVLSLSEEVITSGQVKLTDGSYQDLSKLKNKDDVDLSQIVLLKCTFDDYNKKTLYLTPKDVYYIGEGDFPDDYIQIRTDLVRLVE
jgi:hypothetical protein